MKKISTELETYITTRRDFECAYLFDLTLPSGAALHFCEYSTDLEHNGRRYASDFCITNHGGGELSGRVTVDKLNITIYTDKRDTIEGVPLLEVARAGGLDRARMVVSRMYLDGGEPVGVLELFAGILEVKSAGGLAIQCEVKSRAQELNTTWPARRYYPTCPYSLYDKACGVNRDKYAVYARIEEVTGAGSFIISTKEHAPEWFTGGAVSFLTGPLVGQAATIRASNEGQITLLVAPETRPRVGDQVKLYPGCDKTPATCRNKFNNGEHNRSTPYVPLKEAAY